MTQSIPVKNGQKHWKLAILLHFLLYLGGASAIAKNREQIAIVDGKTQDNTSINTGINTRINTGINTRRDNTNTTTKRTTTKSQNTAKTTKLKYSYN